MSEGRRCRVIKASDRFLTELFNDEPKNYRVIEGAMPDDARIVDVKFDGLGGVIVFLVESAEFDPVPDGKPYPECLVSVKQTFGYLHIAPSGN